MPFPTRTETANDRFKRGASRWTGLGLVAAVATHAAIFALAGFDVGDLGAVETRELEIVLPPETHLPPPPDDVPRPAAPRIGDVDLGDATIPPTNLEDWTPRQLLPPRAPDQRMDRSRFIPYDTPPVLRNRDEIGALLRRARPRGGLTGEVELWLYVSAAGDVERAEIKASSGAAAIDEAALGVAVRMRFTPARNRDRPVPVWVSQWVTFRIR